MYGATFRTELQQSQRNAIKHAKRTVKQRKHLRVLADKCEYSETKTRRGELQWGKLSRQTLMHETAHNLSHSPVKRSTMCIVTNLSVHGL
jgi:hypothetical protein